MSTASVTRPTPSPCPECGTTRVLAEGLNSIRVARSGVGVLRQGSADNNTEFWALVCPGCGHTAWYAKDPARLRG